MLGELVIKVLEYLRSRIDQQNGGCAYVEALDRAFNVGVTDIVSWTNSECLGDSFLAGGAHSAVSIFSTTGGQPQTERSALSLA
jgi:hypothetical protein